MRLIRNYYGQEKEEGKEEGKEVAPLSAMVPRKSGHPLERKAVLWETAGRFYLWP